MKKEEFLELNDEEKAKVCQEILEGKTRVDDIEKMVSENIEHIPRID